MAFAAVLTALGYYIILRRFCQGLLKIFLQGAATGGSFPSLPPATPAFGVLPCPPPPAGDGSGRSRRQGRGTALPPGAWFAPCSGAARRGQGTAPRAALVRPAPGERTISNAEVPLPGPPSPWLPALPIERLFYRFCGEPQVQPRGCKGLRPLHEITLVSPFPAGEGGRGIGGRKIN